MSGGSFGRISSGAEIGLSDDSKAIYIAANRTHESGWRPHSSSISGRSTAMWAGGAKTGPNSIST